MDLGGAPYDLSTYLGYIAKKEHAWTLEVLLMERE
jgi:hypothetical protein